MMNQLIETIVMKILVSANNYPTPEYPLQAFIGVLCEELTRQGHEVTVIAGQTLAAKVFQYHRWLPYHSQFRVRTVFGEKCINVYRPKIFAITTSRLKRLFYYLAALATNKTANSIDSDFDCVYCHFWSSADKILSYVSNKKIPMFVASGEDVIHKSRFVNQKRIDKINKLTKGVICVSTKNKVESIEKGFSDANRCIVLPNAVDNSVFQKMTRSDIRQELGIPLDAFVVVYCGRFNNRKGAFRLEGALNEIADDNIKSIFIGLPESGQTRTPKCRGLHFCGALPHEDIGLYLNAADVFVLPSLAEGCSNSIVEAMACGLPIISSDLSFNYDILDESNAILIDPNSVTAIKEAILKLRSNGELCKIMSESSLNKARNLTIEKRVASIVDFIESNLHECN